MSSALQAARINGINEALAVLQTTKADFEQILNRLHGDLQKTADLIDRRRLAAEASRYNDQIALLSGQIMHIEALKTEA